ncbi:isoprenoid synthase domain-containing protein [Xylaria arbuscula]|nr:isoprenoid synthase domain-containing protein [Xylaria arbuscula]
MSGIAVSDHVPGELETRSTRDILLHRIKGRTIHLPRIDTEQVNPWLPILRRKVAKRLANLQFDPERQRHLEAADLAYFTALWWPDAELERLETLAYLVIWLFTWDDEIDQPTGLYTEDYAGAKSYRDDTLNFVAACLGFMPKDSIQLPLNDIIQSFDIIASQVEQKYRLMGILPTLKEYWNLRLGTSAVYIGIASAEFLQTNIIISITNDLLSMKKEIERGCIDSLVPLAFASSDDTKTVISQAIQLLKAAKAQFERLATALIQEAGEGDCSVKVQRFIEVQRSNCVGNLIWRL